MTRLSLNRLRLATVPLLFGGVIFPLAIISSACLANPADGSLTTPAAPGSNAPSRLPQLLQQLQGGGAGLELFDATPQASATSQVLGVQDTGKSDVATTTPVTGATTTTTTPTRAGTNEAGTTGRPTTPVPPATPVPPTVTSPTPGGTPTATPTALATATPTRTPTPIPTLGTEGTSTPRGGGSTPPTESRLTGTVTATPTGTRVAGTPSPQTEH